MVDIEQPIEILYGEREQSFIVERKRKLVPCREPGCPLFARAKNGARYCVDHARKLKHPITGRNKDRDTWRRLVEPVAYGSTSMNALRKRLERRWAKAHSPSCRNGVSPITISHRGHVSYLCSGCAKTKATLDRARRRNEQGKRS